MTRNAIGLILKRTLANWRLLTAVIIGSTLAGTIMSASVVYFESLRDIALQKELADQAPADLDILMEVDKVPSTREADAEVAAVMQEKVISRISKFTNRVSTSKRTWTFFVDEPPDLVPSSDCPCRPTVAEPDYVDEDGNEFIECDCRRIQCMTVADETTYTEIVEGIRPNPVRYAGGSELTVEAMLDRPSAEAFGIQVGDIVPARPHWDEPRQSVNIKLTGIYQRRNADSVDWRIHDQAFGNRSSTLTIAQFVFPPATISDALALYFPNMGSEHAWFFDIAPELIHATDTTNIRTTLELTENELRSVVDGFVMDTELDSTLLRFEVELFFNRLPMFIVLILIVLVVVYYTSTLAGLLIDAQSSDMALLRSRGSTSRQLFAMFLVEAVILATFAVTLGPVLAMGGVSLIGTIPFYDQLTGGEPMPVNFTTNVFLMAVLAAVMVLVALLVPAIRATRRNVLAERAGRARPQRLAFIQRYYIDLGFLALVMFMFWQLTRQGSFVATNLFGENVVNQVILAVPAVFLVAAGIVLLRLFPLAMELLARVLASRWVSKVTPPAVVLGIWQMARNPSHYSRISLLLILTAGLGVFAASFAATLERSAREQVLYSTGADIRVTSVSTRAGGRSVDVDTLMSELNGVETATSIYRLRGSLISGFSADQFTLFAADLDAISDVAWYRDDFAPASYADQLHQIKTDFEPGLLLPEQSRWISARIKPLVSMQNVALVARISDKNGRFYSVGLGTLLPDTPNRQGWDCNLRFADPETAQYPIPTWCRIGVSLQPIAFGRNRPLQPERPFRLHSIGVTTFDGAMPSGAIDIDDIAVHLNIVTDMRIIEDFNSAPEERWTVMRPTTESFADALEPSPLGAWESENPGLARFRWTEGNPGQFRGITYGSGLSHSPVLVSPSLLDDFAAEVGETVGVNIENERIDLEIVGVIDYFPTLNPDTSRFAIMDRDYAESLINSRRISNERRPNEIWVSTETGIPSPADLETLLDEVGTTSVSYAATGRVNSSLNRLGLRSGAVVDRLRLLSDVSVDPLVSEGWRALLGVAFVTVLVVTAVGFLVHTRVSFRNKLQEFALLRTIGLSMRQLMLLVLLEQAIVIGVAIALGIFVGTRLGDTIMPYLASSGQEATVVPPMTLEIAWTGFLTTFGLLAVVFGLLVIIGLIQVYRMAIHRVMRMGEA